MEDNNAKNIIKSGLGIAGKLFIGSIFQNLKFTGILLAPFFIVILVLLLFISVVPISLMFNGEQAKDTLVNATTYDYIFARNNVGSPLVNYANDKYDCRATVSGNWSYREGLVSSKTCRIYASFYPELDEFATNITAYTKAVDSTIEQYYPQSETSATMPLPNESIIDIKDGSIDNPKDDINLIEINDYGKEYLGEDYKDDYNSKYAKDLKRYSNSFFIADTNAERWSIGEHWITHESEKVYSHCNVTNLAKPYDENTCPLNYKVYKDVSYEIDNLKVNIPVYYSIKSYKADILDETSDYMVGQYTYETVLKSEDGKTQMELVELDKVKAKLLLEKTIEINYYNALGGEKYDNRQDFFAPLINAGYVFTIPIWGVDFGMVDAFIGGDGVSGSVFSNLSGSTQAIWQAIKQIINPKYNYQCTAFARYWFYLLTGDKGLRGNGSEMADYAIADGKLSPSSLPVAGGIFSIKTSDAFGHVGCIDEVDYEKKTITISEGNADGKGSIVLKREYTFDGFNSYVNGVCKYHNNGAGACSLTYAVPN